MHANSDAALIAQAQAGSSQAFSRLVAQHQQPVRAFLRRLTGDWAEADDVAQQAFVAAWTHLARFERGRDFRLWLCGVAYRKFLAARRSHWRRRRREEIAVESQEMTATPDSDDRLDLRKAMAALPEEPRAAIALCLAAGYSHGEAAEALGIPLGTVKSHVQRGRAALIAILRGGHE
ncbi:MAG: RNA polymerase sigma factor [Alphaproteobacteria bacterium]|nr:RNA polymerase sigma factor [Alphaproteobacteria bacterium]